MFTMQDVINTLNQVEVHGKDNLDRLLGAIMALEAIMVAQDNAAQEDAKRVSKETLEEPTAEGE